MLLKVDQSVEERSPRFEAEAVGRFRVSVPPSAAGEPDTFTSTPEVPSARAIVEFWSALLGMFATETVGVNVKVPVEFVMVCPTVTPFEVAADDVASVMFPACPVPYVCATERTPVFVTFPPEYWRPEEKVVVATQDGTPLAQESTWPPVP